ncbi:CPBP family intramembrane glutamic endopeptidase [Dickeya solani]|uniref:Metal-dependent membrane protease n=1 Tax=Dickeya solani D s0432-1 TaxID=1231725 RepID=A0AAV3KAD4_9GAMM|nr:CPBP family intramembrane glutamic endopeptidase [Dickeya solani]ANE75093.1 CAAX protease [Dickeya solani IPO 2222]AUC42452.1 Putative membrane protein precursor [Dickeya solani RNS 08.23.3.1.A]AUH09493.1 CAAX protease [Dickeya solani D s0432-1]AUH13464.1 CAAX protease [Dickeya solani]AYQ49626.1 CAAX amino terminal protease self- immunity [Dickeya solani]
MWIMLAGSLLTLQFNRTIAVLLLLATLAWGLGNSVLAWSGAGFLALLGLVMTIRAAYRSHVVVRGVTEILLVVGVVALTLHLAPGFDNPKVVDNVYVGPQSTAFSMYFNLDKALIPFVLLACMPTLFSSSPVRSLGKWVWCLLALAVPMLLLAGGLKLEIHNPSWLWSFMLANLFFVSLAEEALFRGYLQQRLAGVMSPWLALPVSALLFGALHFPGGAMLMAFAALAGLLYGLAWMWSGRLWVATLFHFGLNLCHLLFFTYPMLQRGV